MTNLTPKSQFDDVYQLERNDPALAGPGGVLNKPLQDLTNRTEYLKDNKADKSEIVKGQYSFTTLAKFNEKKATIPADSTVIIEEAGANQGTNTWDGTTLTKSVYDPLAQAKADASTKAEAAKNDAITAAATDASTKSQAAETNAKLAAQNTDVKLLTSIQQIIDAVAHFRNDYDVDLAALSTLMSSNDVDANTRISRLLIALQQVALTISDNRDELDALINSNTTAITANSSAITLLQASQTNANVEMESANSRIARLLLSIQQLALIISDNRDELDLLINSNTSAISTLTLEDQSINTRVLRLNTGLQNIVDSITQVTNDLSDAFTYFSEENKLARLYQFQAIAAGIARLDDIDAESNTIQTEKVIIFPVPQQLIRIDISYTEGLLPSAKGSVLNTEVKFNVDSQVFSCYGTIEVQGSSSAGMPKKNWTIALFADSKRKEALQVKLGNLNIEEELVWKANFIDNTQARNITVNRLYAQMMQSRSGFPKREVDAVNMLNPDLSVESTNGLAYMPSGATGHVDGFPAVVYINQNFYGIGTLNCGKKRTNYNLDKNNQKHIQLEPEGGLALLNMPEDPTQGAFDIRRPSSWGTDAQASYDRLRLFLKFSQSEMINAGIDNYINRKQMMDYIILCQVCDLWDHLHKNTLFTTWDGLIWNFMPYDLDSVFGLSWQGLFFNGENQIRPAGTLLIPANTPATNWGVLAKFRLIYGNDIDQRYAALRKAKIIDVDNITNIAESILRKFPKPLLDAENSKWNTGSTNIASSLIQSGSIHQIFNWLSIRIPLVDAYFNYTA